MTKYFFLFFILFLLIFNWNEISWVFSLVFWQRFTEQVFTSSPSVSNSPTSKEFPTSSFSQVQSEFLPQKVSENKNQNNQKKANSIFIPKIEIEAPLVFVNSETEIKKALDNGVVHYPGSSLPGEKGNVIFLGHSAPPNWPKIKYDWVFSKLNILMPGDHIFLYFEDKEFLYLVKSKYFLKKGENLPITDSEKSNLLLVSCWPPGKNLNRIVVLAELVR
ncbi:class E sortase [Candidatus Parcubacteria bacterium]|nr:class E sortase [Candidatus Parcubacteria bacterium]